MIGGMVALLSGGGGGCKPAGPKGAGAGASERVAAATSSVSGIQDDGVGVRTGTTTFVRAELVANIAKTLLVEPASYDFANNPKLLERILEAPHGYFRFVNVAFSQSICRSYKEVFDGVPAVNLHGDAHLEQYAVTDLGRGLTDFDDSSKGPAVLDLIRFGVSLHLALRSYAPDVACEPIFAEFLKGYRAALEDPDLEAPEPAWVAQIRTRFKSNREKYFDWITSIMKPVPKPRLNGLQKALVPYVKAMVAKHEELDRRFFEVVSVGRLEMGIGSALDEKYLLRIRGPSDDPLDDAVLEVKEVRSLAGIDCIEGSRSADPFRILLAQARIAYKPYAYLGYIDLEGKKFWIHSWVDNYKELSLDRLRNHVDKLSQVAYDVGVQLGRGHPKIAGDFELQLRQALIGFLDDHVADMRAAVPIISDATVQAWRRFREKVPTSKGIEK